MVELELVLHGGHEPAAKEVAQVVDGVFALELCLVCCLASLLLFLSDPRVVYAVVSPANHLAATLLSTAAGCVQTALQLSLSVLHLLGQRYVQVNKPK